MSFESFFQEVRNQVKSMVGVDVEFSNGDVESVKASWNNCSVEQFVDSFVWMKGFFFNQSSSQWEKRW